MKAHSQEQDICIFYFLIYKAFGYVIETREMSIKPEVSVSMYRIVAALYAPSHFEQLQTLKGEI
jgi:hypothetical protein